MVLKEKKKNLSKMGLGHHSGNYLLSCCVFSNRSLQYHKGTGKWNSSKGTGTKCGKCLPSAGNSAGVRSDRLGIHLVVWIEMRNTALRKTLRHNEMYRIKSFS